MARTNSEAVAQIIDLLDVQPNDKVVEIGFGPGVGIHILARLVSAGYVRGIDPSSEMVEQAAARNARAIRRGQVEIKRGSAESLPFAADTFDKALAVNSMQVWPYPASGLREIRRVMKPAAKVALGFTVHSGQPNEGLTDRLLAAGFTDVDVVQGDKWFCVLASKP